MITGFLPPTAGRVTPRGRGRHGEAARSPSASSATCPRRSRSIPRCGSGSTSPSAPSSAACRAASVKARVDEAIRSASSTTSRRSRSATSRRATGSASASRARSCTSRRCSSSTSRRSGLDPRQIVKVRDLIRDLRKDHTILLSTHILPEVELVCDRILIIDRGRIVASGTPDTLRHQMSQTPSRHGRPEGRGARGRRRAPRSCPASRARRASARAARRASRSTAQAGTDLRESVFRRSSRAAGRSSSSRPARPRSRTSSCVSSRATPPSKPTRSRASTRTLRRPPRARRWRREGLRRDREAGVLLVLRLAARVPRPHVVPARRAAGCSWCSSRALNSPETPRMALMSTFFTNVFQWIFLMLVSAIIAMRLLTEERKSGSIETLLTAPVSEATVVAAKFTGAWCFFLFLFVPTAIYPLLLSRFGGLDSGPILVGLPRDRAHRRALHLRRARSRPRSRRTRSSRRSRVRPHPRRLHHRRRSRDFLPFPGARDALRYLNILEHMDDFSRGHRGHTADPLRRLDGRLLPFPLHARPRGEQGPLRWTTPRKTRLPAPRIARRSRSRSSSASGSSVLVNYIGSRRYARFDWTTTRPLLSLREDPQRPQGSQDSRDGHRLHDARDAPLPGGRRASSALQGEERRCSRSRRSTRRATPSARRPSSKRPASGTSPSSSASGDKKKIVTEDRIVEYDYSRALMGGEPSVKSFRGEQEFTSAILERHAGEGPEGRLHVRARRAQVRRAPEP